jgi:hypothetical protein
MIVVGDGRHKISGGDPPFLPRPLGSMGNLLVNRSTMR